MGGGGLGHKARSLDWSGAARDHVIMCESIGVEFAAVVVEPAVFGWVMVRLPPSGMPRVSGWHKRKLWKPTPRWLLHTHDSWHDHRGAGFHIFATRDSHHPPYRRQPRRRDLEICSAPRGAVKCDRAGRRPARAAMPLVAAPVPHVAGAKRSHAIGPTPLTL